MQSQDVYFFDSCKVFSYNGKFEGSFFVDLVHMNADGVDMYCTCLSNFLRNTFVN